MIDGTVSSLAPIFAAAIASNSHTALLVGFSTALGAGVSMGWSEALSDTGEQTGRGSAVVRGAITGGMTALGGVFHTLPFLISNVHQALFVAGIVVAIELFTIAWIRNRFLDVSLRSSLLGRPDRARNRRRHRQCVEADRRLRARVKRSGRT
jgi:hypothetical protein